MAIQTGQRTSKSKSSKGSKAAPKKEAAATGFSVKKGDEFLATGVSPTGTRFKVDSVSKDGVAVLSSGDTTLPVRVDELEDSESWVAT
jgi:hypothetical protein